MSRDYGFSLDIEEAADDVDGDTYPSGLVS